MAEETRSEQLAQKVTPSTRKKLDEILKKMGHLAEPDGHVKWDQEKLLDIIGVVESTLVLENRSKYADVVSAINQYTSLINSKLISIISDLDTTEARIRSEYEKKLASREDIIKDLQDKRQEQEVARSAALEDASKSKDEKIIAEKNLLDANEKLKVVEESIKDKEAIIQMLTSKLKDSEEKLIGYDGLKNAELSLREQVSALLHKVELVESEKKHESDLKSKALDEESKVKKQLTVLQKEYSEVREQLQSIKRDLEEEKRMSIQRTALEVQKAVAESEKEMQEKMALMREERTRLQVQFEGIQNDYNSIKNQNDMLKKDIDTLLQENELLKKNTDTLLQENEKMA